MCPLAFLEASAAALDIRNHLRRRFRPLSRFFPPLSSLDLSRPHLRCLRPFLGSFAPLARGVLRDNEIHGLSHSAGPFFPPQE